MAAVTVIIGESGGAGQHRGAPVHFAGGRVRHDATSSGSNQVLPVAAAAYEVITMIVTGGTVDVAFAEGSNPDASAGVRYPVGDGSARVWSWQARAADTRIAIKDAG